MLELAFLAGAAVYVVLAAAIPFVLLWDLFFSDLGLSNKERKRRYQRLVEAADKYRQAPPQ